MEYHVRLTTDYILFHKDRVVEIYHFSQDKPRFVIDGVCDSQFTYESMHQS